MSETGQFSGFYEMIFDKLEYIWRDLTFLHLISFILHEVQMTVGKALLERL